MGCNTAVEYIGSGVNAKAAMCYVSDYITKNNLAFANMVTVCAAAIEKYASLQEAQGSLDQESDRQRRTIIKCLNGMHADMEISGALVATYLLEYNDYYTSHQFVYIFTHYFLALIGMFKLKYTFAMVFF